MSPSRSHAGAHAGTRAPRAGTSTGTGTGTRTATRLAVSSVSVARMIDLAAMTGLMAVGVVAFGPAFSGVPGYVAGLGGVLIGMIVGGVSAARRWSFFGTASVALVAGVALGGALALPSTTVGGVLPTAETVQRLVFLTYQSWRDLLTVSVPANSFTGPAVVPYVSGLVCSLLAVSAALRIRRYLWALAPGALMLVIGILWGTRQAPAAIAQGAVFAILSFAWAAWRVALGQYRTNAGILRSGSRVAPAHRTRALAAVGVLAVAVVGGSVAGPALAGTDRHVLRDDVTPPLDLRDYASPLTQYRYLERDLRDETLLTVTGLPEGARVRVAAVDMYDGNVYNVDAASADFRKVGREVGDAALPAGGLTTLGVTVGAYRGVWVPGGGDVRGIRFSAGGAEALADGTYFNRTTGTLLTTAGLAPGARYQVDLAMPQQPSDKTLQKAAVAQEPMPDSTNVPDVIASMTPDFVGNAVSPLDQLRNLEAKFRDQGYYANGQKAKSRAGHTTERITTLLSLPQMIGDDEQYAVAMALMVRQLGYPARVVMGFYPESAAEGPQPITGWDAHAWVEVPFEGYGWIPFDPTPDRDKTPQTKVPKPQDVPQPMVIPPPVPPAEPVVPPDDRTDDAKSRQKQDDQKHKFPPIPASVRIAGLVLAGGAVLAAPFAGIVLLKRARRTRRRSRGRLSDRISAGWAEVLDHAADLGVGHASTSTRRESATALAERFPATGPLAVAERIDARVYGPTEPTADDVRDMWSEVNDLLGGMRSSVGIGRRLRAAVSLRSLTGSWRRTTGTRP